MRPNDTTKLPKWAQSRISVLERDLAYERERLMEGPEDSNTFADPYATAPRPLGKDTHIEFRLDGGKVSARIENGNLFLLASGGRVKIQPHSSNTFTVEVER